MDALCTRQIDIENKIRTIDGFPKPGILFHNITTVLQKPQLFKQAIDSMLLGLKTSVRIDNVCGIEARGFIFGSVLANKLDVGFVPIRKLGKLPYSTFSQFYDMEYAKNKLEIHTDALKPEENVLIVDDLLATGGTALAAEKLLLKCGVNSFQWSFLIELTEFNSRSKLQADHINVIVEV